MIQAEACSQCETALKGSLTLGTPFRVWIS
jgi:hypothetical protein